MLISDPAISETAAFEQNQAGLWIPRRCRHIRPTCIDLFCGCGGFSLGMIEAGYEVLMGVENDSAATATYLYNLGSNPLDLQFTSPQWRQKLENYLEGEYKRAEKQSRKNGTPLVPFVSGGNSDRTTTWTPVRHFYFGDVHELTGEMILRQLDMDRGEIDCVVGGPPCQGFSVANRRRTAEDPRNSLVFQFVRLVLELQPKTMVMENVPGLAQMTTAEGVPVIDAICRVLEDGGFGAYEALRKSILSTAGLGAAVRTRGSSKGKEKAARSCPDPQAELFAEAPA